MTTSEGRNLKAAKSRDVRLMLEEALDTIAARLDEEEVNAFMVAKYLDAIKAYAALRADDAKPKGVRDELKAKRDGRTGGRAAAHASGNA